jgi:hypothetical protein
MPDEKDDSLIGLSGIRPSDAAICSRVHNIAIGMLAEDKTAKMVKRLRIVAGLLMDSADRASNISAEESGVMDCARFWKSRAAGARGDGNG